MIKHYAGVAEDVPRECIGNMLLQYDEDFSACSARRRRWLRASSKVTLSVASSFPEVAALRISVFSAW